MSDSSAQELINQFRQLIVTTTDDRKDLQKVMNFLSTLQTYRTTVPPTAEFVTIMKHKLPVLFQYLRKNVSSASHLHFIIQLDMDYRTAVERLNLKDDPSF